ncbi:hypothetical protein [Halorubellus salinus]|uniref:hypothetical protein n=1 Tax=Halorubellus salinus TaxID=755309 RepID=UPI001D079269|nr:hypothetical protein [Halorubellus salinus]
MRRLLLATVAVALASALDPTVASLATSTGVLAPLHVGALSDAVNVGTVPSWLTVATGGVLVGGSFLGTSLLTDHEGVRAVNAWSALVPTTATLRRALVLATRVVGVLGLALVLRAATVGSTDPTANFAIVVVWIGWWAGFAMTTYLAGNAWPVLNPWRTVVDALPGAGGRALPADYGAWPAVVGLLALVYVEVVSPLAADPRLLGVVVAAYSVLTLAGAYRYGPDAWFERVDPVSRVFAVYGRLAPLQRDANGVRLRLPGSGLVAGARERLRGESTETAVLGAESGTTALLGRESGTTALLGRESGMTTFVVALLWATTFDGLVTTPAWNDLATVVVEAGVPALGVYLVALVAGFAAFRVLYRVAAERSRAIVDSRLSPAAIESWFAPALVPIAAGYHVAHFLGYFLSLSPALEAVLRHPLGGGGVPQVAVLPGWFGTVELGFVVVGHLLAVWVAHALALELFPGLLRPIRSQYPFVVVMVAYTMTSAWVIGQPFVDPVYL